MSLIFTQNCKVNVFVGGSGVLASGDDCADIVPVNPIAYAPTNAIGPVTAGAPQPVSSLVFGGTTSVTFIAVMFAAVVFVPTTRYAMHFPGVVLALAAIAILLHGAFGTLPVNVVAGVVAHDPVPAGLC